MLTLEQIRKQLEDRNIQAVARGCGVSADAIYRLMKPHSQPAYLTVKAVSDYLERNQ
jgi:DNA-binding phage protein